MISLTVFSATAELDQKLKTSTLEYLKQTVTVDSATIVMVVGNVKEVSSVNSSYFKDQSIKIVLVNPNTLIIDVGCNLKPIEYNTLYKKHFSTQIANHFSYLSDNRRKFKYTYRCYKGDC